VTPTSNSGNRRSISAIACLRGAVLAVLTVSLAACGDTAVLPDSGEVTEGAANSSSSSIRARQVAADYFAAIADGDYEQASTLVVPSQQDALRAMALGQDRDDLALSAEVHVGKVDLDGTSATATLIGRMCHAQPRSCVSNQDLDTTDPVFLIHLSTQETGDWRVIFGVSP
jgi:hypothetical protein